MTMLHSWKIQWLSAGIISIVGFSAAMALKSSRARPRPVTERPSLAGDELRTIELFEKAAPSVVHITTESLATDYFSFNTTRVPAGTGTGFIWDEYGHIVTNFHVLQNGDYATVILSDRTTHKASLVGAAPERDLAVLRIKPNAKMRPLALGTSHDLRVGQSVYAIGNPFSLDQTLTTGVISALGREIESVIRSPIKGVIQTDAAINPGNSGGPLLDSSGRLIGVNTAIYSPSGASSGIGFAIPVDTVNWVAPELIAYGKITRPDLGVEVAPDRLTFRWQIPGVLILQVVPNGAAFKAGLQGTRRLKNGDMVVGDIILEVDGKRVRSESDLTLAVIAKNVGDELVLTLQRGDQQLTKTVKLAGTR